MTRLSRPPERSDGPRPSIRASLVLGALAAAIVGGVGVVVAVVHRDRTSAGLAWAVVVLAIILMVSVYEQSS